jgi:hypothetical protein
MILTYIPMGNAGGAVFFGRLTTQSKVYRSNLTGGPGVGTPVAAIYVYEGANNNYVYDSILAASNNYGVRTSWNNPYSSSVYLINVTGELSTRWDDSPSSSLFRGWWIDAYVNDTAGSTLEDANVSFIDGGSYSTNPTETGYNLTGADGRTSLIAYEYEQTAVSTFTYFNNYTFNASKDGSSEALIRNVTDNQMLTFTLASFWLEAPVLYNEDGSNQLAFNNIRQNSQTPTFRVSANTTDTYDRWQLELNNESDFTGTSYIQNFTGTYSSNTQYNIAANSLSPSLPSTDNTTYYVRVRGSADSGTSWSGWSQGTWSYTYTSDDIVEWFQQEDAQYETGTEEDVIIINNTVTISTGPSGLSATGGTIVDSGGYRMHIYNSTGNFYFNASTTGEVEVLIVAGGGGSGGGGSTGYAGGAGGGGGVIYNSSYNISSASNITVSVGSGGSAGTQSGDNGERGGNGSDSTFGILEAVGGGGGGPGNSITPDPETGSVGGSGGGGATYSGVGGSGTSGQGNSGGSATSTCCAGGGGGGAGTAGGSQSGTTGGSGGQGLQYNLTGSNVYYGGGGAGKGSGGNGAATNGATAVDTDGATALLLMLVMLR